VALRKYVQDFSVTRGDAQVKGNFLHGYDGPYAFSVTDGRSFCSDSLIGFGLLSLLFFLALMLISEMQPLNGDGGAQADPT